MKSSKTVATTAVLFLILSTAFAMSGDGGQEPVKAEKKTEAVQVQSEQGQQDGNPDLSDQSKSNTTVKDWFGFDTGMTKDELEEFKEGYMKLKAKLLPYSKTDMLYNFKVDLNKIKELKEVGVDLFKSGVPVDAATYKDNTLYSEIIVIGTIDTDKKISDRIRPSLYEITIEKVLKGEDILIEKLGKVPDIISISYAEGCIDCDNETIVLNQKSIYFLERSDLMTKEAPWLYKVPYSTILYLDNAQVIYEKHIEMYHRALRMERSLMEKPKSKNPKDDPMGEKYEREVKIIKNTLKHSFTSWEDTIGNIKKILEINDEKNFYKKSFEVKE
jgi:hypothetical protein